EVVEAAAGGGEGAGAAAESGPRVLLLREAPEDVLDRVAAGVQLRVLQLVPVQRRGDGGPRAGADGVGRHGRVGVRVPHDVEEHAVAPLRLPLLGRQQVRVAAGQHAGRLAGEVADGLEVGAAVEGDDDVEAAGARRHEEGG